MTLGTESFTLFQAGDGEESLAIAKAERLELVLLDPQHVGSERSGSVRSNQGCERLRHTKVVMLTASGNSEDSEKAMALGADDYFVKPFSPVVLLDKIYDLLDQPSTSSRC